MKSGFGGDQTAFMTETQKGMNQNLYGGKADYGSDIKPAGGGGGIIKKRNITKSGIDNMQYEGLLNYNKSVQEGKEPNVN